MVNKVLCDLMFAVSPVTGALSNAKTDIWDIAISVVGIGFLVSGCVCVVNSQLGKKLLIGCFVALCICGLFNGQEMINSILSWFD